MRKFTRSQELYDRASKVVPGAVPGHQNPAMLGVVGTTPCYIERAEGSRLWDVDGNEYIDYMCAYGPMVIGYNHPKVEDAAEAQRKKGDCFNLPSPRYVELAERLVNLVPIADWAVFGKNGSDVTSWSCTVARAHTGRPKIIMAEETYHGMHPWCTSFPGGITPEDKANVLTFKYNDADDLKRVIDENEGQAAGIILTPFRHEALHDSEMPAEGFLDTVRQLCDDHDIVFIIDDVRAGFRLHMGGSAEYFGVRPDLTAFSKALGNGHAISACVGREGLREAASQAFFTGSFFYNAVSMAAALATLDEMETMNAIDKMFHIGQMLKDGLESQAEIHGIEVNYTGPVTLPFMTFTGEDRWQKARLFAAECFQRGVFFNPLHNWFISAAHTEEDIQKTLEASDAAFNKVKESL